MQTQAQARVAAPAFPLFRLPPPLMFAATFALSAIAQHVLPLPTVRFGEPEVLAGVALLAFGIGAGAALALTFLRRRTTLNPFADPSHFVARGPYRLTRNPMYLTLMVAYLGGAILLGSLWTLVLLVVPLAILARVVIPTEEARMHATFGDSYRDYCCRVRRWL